MPQPIRFKFAPEKAVAALHWMVRERGHIDLYAALKACYFADKHHLNMQQRPIFGATYRAMRFGPVPIEIYEIAEGEALWLAELGRERLPWRLDGYRLSLTENVAADLEELSESDRSSLFHGFDRSINLDFNARTAATHGHDWQAARLGMMRYEDMLEKSPSKPKILAYLEENARFLRL